MSAQLIWAGKRTRGGPEHPKAVACPPPTREEARLVQQGIRLLQHVLALEEWLQKESAALRAELAQTRSHRRMNNRDDAHTHPLWQLDATLEQNVEGASEERQKVLRRVLRRFAHVRRELARLVSAWEVRGNARTRARGSQVRGRRANARPTLRATPAPSRRAAARSAR